MPIHVSPISRRTLLAGGSAAASLAVLPTGWAAEEADANVIALLADTHIPKRPDVEAREVNMTGNLRQVVGELSGLSTKPAGVIVNGDCAYLKGLPDDYANFASCIRPLAEAGLPLHVTMGNHDDRDPLYSALSTQRSDDSPVESKHVSIIETPHANLFLLDSLREVNVVTGELGGAQRAWLARALDAHRHKPAVVVAHHNPQFQDPPEGDRWTGLKDSTELFELLEEKKHVKAYVFGHTHRWSISERNGIHLINLPPVAYLFDAAMPNGWVRATLHDGGMDLELRAIDPAHKQHGQRVELAWR